MTDDKKDMKKIKKVIYVIKKQNLKYKQVQNDKNDKVIKIGAIRELNPGPPVPQTGIIPLDQSPNQFHFSLLSTYSIKNTNNPSSSFFFFTLYLQNTIQQIQFINIYLLYKQNKLLLTSNNKNFTLKALKVMDKFKEKELLQLKNQQAKTAEAYQESLNLLLHNQTIKIMIEFSKKQLQNIDISKIQSINDYSPVSISRLIFAEQLSKIKHQISILPNNKCPLMHFLIIMLKIVKFPFDKVPYYLLGLKQMFSEIKNDERQDYVHFSQIESYMLGQVVNFTDDNQLDTEFEIRFAQNKMQDFLMHDNGIKKIIYSNDLHKYIVLDENSSFIKIYDDNMKMVAKFEPNKEKHNKKHPNILTFDYDEFGSKLGISQSDNTFSMIHLGNFLSDVSEDTFRSVFLNEIIYKSNAVINKIYFLSMMNKWLCIDQSNEIWIYDVQNFKEQNQNYYKKLKHPNDDYEITDVLELIGLSSIAFVIHNEIWFYNESLSNKKWKKFSHSQEIKKLIYDEERNQFYLVGKQEKFITIFTLNKMNGEPNKIWTFQTNQIIADFEVFAFNNTILILDCKNNLKVYNLDTPVLQYQQNYDFIVKKSQLKIKLVKNSKTNFLIHATYILCMQLKKVAIQRDMQFSYQDMFFYDTNKQEIIFSVNGQIMGISLMHGQIRKNVAVENSNIDKHKAFYLGKNTELFLIDQNDSLYQVLNKNDPRYNDLKGYRKKVGITGMKKSFYDQEYRKLIMISDSSVYMVRNDSHNNFTFGSCLLLENSPQFIKHKYYKKTKELLFLDASNTVYLMKSYNYEIEKIMKLNVFKEWDQGEKILIDIQYEEDLKVLMILTNNGQFAIFSIQDPTKALFVKVKDFLPYQLQSNTFTSFSYQKGSNHDKKNYPNRVFFYNNTGLLIEFEIESMIQKIVSNQQITDKYLKIKYIKDTHEIDFITLKQNIQSVQFNLQKSHIYQFDQKNVSYIKAHDKKVVYCQRVFLQEYNLLTIGEDGHIRLWGNNRKIYFDLKMPHMVKIQWNMNELHQKRNQKIVNQIVQFLQNINQTIKKNQQRSILHIDLKKRLKNKSEKIKLNHENPIHIEFENKDLQEIVMNKKDFDPQFMTIDFVKKQKKIELRRMNLTQRIVQPWQKKIQFQQMYQKASPVDKYLHKYQQKMPFDLQMMRNDLHMDKALSQKKNKIKKHEDSLVILPQLKQYLKSKELQAVKAKSFINPQQKKIEDNSYLTNLKQENKFQSCLFVKTQRGPKKNNAFDQIDKYFWRKQQTLINKRWIPNKRGLMKKNQTLEPKSQSVFYSTQNGRVDPLKQVIKIFEQHNKEAMNQKKGRLINIPHLSGRSRQQKRKKV